MNAMNPKAILSRFQLLKAMNTVAQSIADEDVFVLWSHYVPQAGDDDDLMEMVTDDQHFDQLCMLFRICICKGSASGFLPFFDNERQELFGAGAVPANEFYLVNESSTEDR